METIPNYRDANSSLDILTQQATVAMTTDDVLSSISSIIRSTSHNSSSRYDVSTTAFINASNISIALLKLPVHCSEAGKFDP